MSEFEMVTLKSGLKSLRSLEHQETFHPVTGPQAEASILHVGQQRLVERCKEATDRFVIWDVGFGAAANVLAAIEALQGTKTQVEIHSFDKSIAPIQFALSHATELEYLIGHEEKINQLLTHKSIQLSPNFFWQLHMGNFADNLNKAPAPHSILYDPYSPTGNPDMWTLEHFRLLRQQLKPESPCLLTNYTRSTAVRVSLLLAGFYVGAGCEVGEKAETTTASNHLELLTHPLGPQWLERVRVSTNSAPLRHACYSKSPISDSDFQLLKTCPQFI